MNGKYSRILTPALAAGVVAIGASSLRAESSVHAVSHPVGIILAQAAGNPESPGGPNAQTAAKNADHFFAQNAALSDMVEVTASKLAQQKASSPKVKSFADHMVKDHTQASMRLSTIAKAKGWSLPTQIDPTHSTAISNLQKQEGAEFDRSYMTMMVADHELAVKLFEKEAKDGKDSEAKAHAAALLPNLKEHLQMAKSIQGELKKK
jgi:putative membrane protein